MRILIADDESVIRMGLRAMLEDDGHAVVGAASSGEAAVSLAATLHPDLILLDIKMPGMDGLEAAQRIMAEHPAPIVMLTAYSQRDLIERASAASVFGYLVKPVKEDALTPMLELARARFEEWKEIQAQAQDLRASLESRDLVERAKRILIERERLSEKQAFLRIHRASRERRVTMAEVAREILTRAQ